MRASEVLLLGVTAREVDAVVAATGTTAVEVPAAAGVAFAAGTLVARLVAGGAAAGVYADWLGDGGAWLGAGAWPVVPSCVREDSSAPSESTPAEGDMTDEADEVVGGDSARARAMLLLLLCARGRISDDCRASKPPAGGV